MPQDKPNLLYKRSHTPSYQLSISIPAELAQDVSDALAFLMRAGEPLPLNKSSATYTAILEMAELKGFQPEGRDNGT